MKPKCNGVSWGLVLKDISKTHKHPMRDLQQRCLLWRLSKTRAGPVRALSVKQPLLSWTTRSGAANLSNSIVLHEYTHIKSSQSIECTLVLPRIELRDKVSFIIVFSNEIFAILGWTRGPSLRTDLGARGKVAHCRGMVWRPPTSKWSKKTTDHTWQGQLVLSQFGALTGGVGGSSI